MHKSTTNIDDNDKDKTNNRNKTNTQLITRSHEKKPNKTNTKTENNKKNTKIKNIIYKYMNNIRTSQE